MYSVYIITNSRQTVFYTGVTNHLSRRLIEHFENRGRNETFAGRYNVHHLLYHEEFEDVEKAIAREKQIKKWRREKKLSLIRSVNPELEFLEELIL